MRELDTYYAFNENLNTPTPSQLRKIALRALLLANRTDKLKKLHTKRTERTHEPSIGWVSQYYDKSDKTETNEVVSCLLTRRIFSLPHETLQFQHAVPLDAWSLRYRHRTQTRDLDLGEEWAGEVRQYAFEWDTTSTLMSQYYRGAIPSMSQEEADRVWALEINGEIPHIDMNGHELDINAVINAHPTQKMDGVVDIGAYEKIMDSLNDHIIRTGNT